MTNKKSLITPKQRELNWRPVKERMLFRDTVSYDVQVSVHDLAPDYLCKKFTKHLDLHERYTHNRDLLLIPMYNTTKGQRIFNYRRAKTWNSLANDLKLNTVLEKF